MLLPGRLLLLGQLGLSLTLCEVGMLHREHLMRLRLRPDAFRFGRR